MSDNHTEDMKILSIFILLGFLVFVVLFAFTAGCVTFTKKQVAKAMETPTPLPTEPTPEPTPEPEPTPVPTITENPVSYMLRTNGYYLREFHHWFRADVQGINGEGKKDLSTWVTIYDYKFMDRYKWYSISWARNFVVKPEDKENRFLFLFINMYSDDRGNGLGDDVRQYGMGCDHFFVQIADNTLLPADWIEYPERRIVDFDNMYTYDHTVTPGPYGYDIVQDMIGGSGVISAQEKHWLFGGRSNSWDGYCQYEIPREIKGNPINETNIKVVGRFDNLGGSAWWKLEKDPNQNL